MNLELLTPFCAPAGCERLGEIWAAGNIADCELGFPRSLGGGALDALPSSTQRERATGRLGLVGNVCQEFFRKPSLLAPGFDLTQESK